MYRQYGKTGVLLTHRSCNGRGKKYWANFKRKPTERIHRKSATYYTKKCIFLWQGSVASLTLATLDRLSPEPFSVSCYDGMLPFLPVLPKHSEGGGGRKGTLQGFRTVGTIRAVSCRQCPSSCSWGVTLKHGGWPPNPVVIVPRTLHSKNGRHP